MAVHEQYIRFTEDEVATILAAHIFNTMRPISPNGYDIREADIVDSIERTDDGGYKFHWMEDEHE